MKTHLYVALVVLFLMMLLVGARTPAEAGGMLPAMAAEMADELDAQLSEKLGLAERPARGYTLILTTPVNLANLEMVSPLARLFAEEMSTWFVASGYRVQEIRKSRNILFAPDKGEMLLTRRVNMLDQKNIQSSIILAGTYTTTSKNIRLNIRLIHAATNEVLAMASGTLPVCGEVRELMDDGLGQGLVPVKPAVATRIRPGAQY